MEEHAKLTWLNT